MFNQQKNRIRTKTVHQKLTFITLLGLAAPLLITACSVESESSKQINSIKVAKAEPQGIYRKNPASVILQLNNSAIDFKSTGFNALRGELITINFEKFYWEQRKRESEAQIDSATWGGCDSLRVHCWNKHSSTYTQEYSPPLLSEVQQPVQNIVKYLEQILAQFTFKNGRTQVCPLSDLLVEKNAQKIVILISNTESCSLYQTDTDEIYELSFINKVQFNEIHYQTGTQVRGDDGNSGEYSEKSYRPETSVIMSISVGSP